MSSTAFSADNDFKLNARLPNGEGIFFIENAPGSFVANDANWRAFVGELSYVFAPRLVQPANSLGYAGFHFGFLYSGTFISADQPYWGATQGAQLTGSPDSVMQTLQLDVRKGLPGSFDLGVQVLWLAKSEMFAPGLQLDWAVVEGYSFAPDIALRGAVNHVVGMRDMNLTVMGFDVLVSKGFGVGGMVNLAPYLGYTVLMSAASSRVVDPTPANEADASASIVMRSLGMGDDIQHKIIIGGKMLAYIVSLSVQGEFQFLKEKADGGRDLFGNVATVSAKLGLDY